MLKCCFDTPALVVARHNNVLHFEMLHRVLHHSKEVDVSRRGNIGNISVNKNLTWLKSHDLICWHSRIGAPDPHVLRLLDTDKLKKIIRLLLDTVFGPLLVIFQYLLEVLHGFILHIAGVGLNYNRNVLLCSCGFDLRDDLTLYYCLTYFIANI